MLTRDDALNRARHRTERDALDALEGVIKAHGYERLADALHRARHHTARDEAQLRQALGALTDPYTWDTEAAIAALRERLGETK